MAVDGADARLWDSIVLGAGAAGLTAATFLARHGRSVLIVDDLMGNHLTNAGTVENFPGFPEGIAGADLAALLQQQALAAGAELHPAAAEGLTIVEGGSRRFAVATATGSRVARTVVVCVGSSLRRLGIDGEERFEGRGISHCATCDGPLFQDRHVAVVGGGDSALDEALYLTSFASKVTVFHRGTAPTGQSVLRERAQESPDIDLRADAEVLRLEGDQQLQALVVRDAEGAEERVDVGGLFVFVGLEPNTRFLDGVVELDRGGHVETDAWLQTSVPGIFAAGDIRRHSAAQFASAAGDGATAAIAVDRLLQAADREVAASSV
jgi:thioredoxin reductase (NADPH)